MAFSQGQIGAVEPVEGRRLLAAMFVVSFLCHVLAALVFLILPQVARSSQRLPTTISVDLVSMAGPGPSAPSAPAAPKAKTPAAKIPAKAEPVPAAKPEPKAAPKTEAPKVLPPDKAKKKAPDGKKSLADALASIQKQVAGRKEDQVASAISEIQKQVQSRPDGGAAASGMGVPGGVASQVFSVMDLYRLEMTDQIRRNWAYPPAMARDSSRLFCEVNITVERNGTISDITPIQRSGDPGYDDSVMRAIKQSQPLPVLPNSFRGGKASFTLQFDSRDLVPWGRANG